MAQIGRPDAHAGEIAFRWQGPVAVGAELLCADGDSAAVFLDGQLLGVLGPGRHSLHPTALPALAPAARPSGQLGVELVFVRTAPLPDLALGGDLGAMRDPSSGATSSVRWHAQARVRVADPARFAVSVLGMGPGPMDDQLADYVRRAFATAAPEALLQRLQATGSLEATFDPGAVPEIISAILSAARPRLTELGVEPLDIGSCAFDVSGGAPPGGPTAGSAAASAGAAMASGLSPSGPIPGGPIPGVPTPDASGAAPAGGGERTFEMLWDCGSCGTRKNLGLTHRHCPECGSPQDAGRRYFPSDEEKVAVEDHVCVGADLKCRYCAQLSGRRAKHCGSCGAPLDDAEGAVRRQDQVGGGPFAGESLAAAQREHAPAAAALAAPVKKKSSKGRWIAGGCGTLVLLVVAAVLVAVFWRREGSLAVAGHTWTREVAIERFGPVQDSAWCDQMPSGATGVRRAREVRSHRNVPDGQECSTRRVDNGDGTYSERQECRPRTRREPVYDQKCYYTVNRWAQARAATATGTTLVPPPQWPPVQLAQQGQCIGCEREGARSETYVVSFLEMESAETATCEFDQARWAGFPVGSRWKGDLSMVGGVLVCDSLRPQ